MSKLTLSVDKSVVEQARRYANRAGVSISEIVEAYLAAIAAPPPRGSRSAPILNSLRGSLKKADREDYRKHLAAKYR
jgi:hypothetical protein